MNRRRFLAALAAIPGLGFLAPRADAGIFRRVGDGLPVTYQVTDKGLVPARGLPVEFEYDGIKLAGTYRAFEYRQAVSRMYDMFDARHAVLYQPIGEPFLSLAISGTPGLPLMPVADYSRFQAALDHDTITVKVSMPQGDPMVFFASKCSFSRRKDAEGVPYIHFYAEKAGCDRLVLAPDLPRPATGA